MYDNISIYHVICEMDQISDEILVHFLFAKPLRGSKRDFLFFLKFLLILKV